MGNAFDEAWLAQHQAKMARGVAASVRHALDTVPAPAPAAKKPRKREEDALQQQVAAYLDWALPAPLKWLHIPNGGRRDAVTAAILKSFGVKPGAADVLILRPQGFIWIELKAPKGVLSEDQKAWRDWCRSIGAPWFVCRSLEDVIEALVSEQITLKGRPV